MSPATNKIPGKRTVLFWLAGLITLSFLLIMTGISLYQSWQKEEKLQHQQRSYYQDQLQDVLHRSLWMVELDISRLATSPLLERHLLQPNSSTQTLLQEVYLSLADVRPVYDQIRLIDTEGNEQIRINRADDEAPYVLPANALQNKAHRYYVAEGMQLLEGNIYVSPLDLNIEHKQVELPFKPMLRIVQPVYLHGKRYGQVVINYRAEELLKQLDNALPQPLQSILINDRGQWLHGNEEQDWSFMFEAHSGLSQQRPALWQQIKAQPTGQITLGQDCLAYAWTHYGSEHVVSPRWLIGFREIGSPCNGLEAQHQSRAAQLLGAGTLAGFMVLFGWHQLRSRRLRLYHRLLVNEQRLRLVTNEMGNGVIMVDAQGCARWMNPEAERLLGWKESEVVGRYLHDIIHVTAEGESLDRDECLTHRALRTGQRQHRERDYLCTREGTVMPVSFTVSPLHQLESGGAVITFNDDREKAITENRLRQQAETDELTGSLNRRAILRHVEQLISTNVRFGVIMFDLDHFKQVNDNYGHGVGDKILIEATRTVQELLRSHDNFGRIGGEEFLLVIDNLNADDLCKLAERIRSRLECHRCEVGDQSLQVTASFGVAMHRPSETLGELLARADEVLYQAKGRGRNVVVAVD